MNLGIGFPETISKSKTNTLFRKARMRSDWGWQSSPLPGVSRHFFILAMFFTLFGLLLFQTVRLQLIHGPYYRVLSEQNRVKTKILHASRGAIYDRNGSELVVNVPGFREIIENCTSPASCVRVLLRDEVLKRKAKGEKLEHLEIDSLRQYTKPKVTTHLLGYISQITQEELADGSFRNRGYLPGDQIGRGGVEEAYEDMLRGKAGRELIETDASGNELRVLGKIDPIPGKNVTLALDSRLQEVAFEAMRGKTGAVVVSNPKTGEILTLVSMPSFNANVFTLGPSATGNVSADEQGEKQYKTASEVISDNQDKPLFNRAISGTYPPGSTFKIITAAAALEKGVMGKDTVIEDTGILRIGSFSFANWYFTQYGKTEGTLTIIDALKRSNDIFFYKAAEAAGVDAIHAMGEQFGLSRQLGIDLPGEVAGIIPTQQWKKETIGEDWYLGDVYHLGIGQGFVLTTPLQINSMTGVIAENGVLCQPTILKTDTCRVKNEKFLTQETIETLAEGMRRACDTGGTGWPLFKFKMKNEKLKIDERNFFPPEEGTESGMVSIPIACKTGTAEFALPAGRQGDPKHGTHAWFTAYAPIADPQIAVTVLIEGGGEGSSVAGPIAKKIFEEWFGR